MKKIGKLIIILSVFLLFGNIAISSSSNKLDPVDPLILTFEPERPYVKSTITITVNLDQVFLDSEIDQVNFIIQECNQNTGVCYQRENKTMDKIGNDYKATFQLTHEDATYIQYSLLAKETHKGWETVVKEEIKQLVDNPDNGNNGGTNNGNNNGNDTPGFEVVGILFGIIFIIYLIDKRKR
jgi:hypothetical protein